MSTTQRYLGMPNAVVLCIDEFVNDDLSGRIYHSYQVEATKIVNKIDALEKMERLFNELNFPFPGNNERHFVKQEEHIEREKKEKMVKDDEILEMHGDLGTFIIRVQHRQNSSWQGRITWVEEDKTLYFRSIWEMMKLIDEAMEKYRPVDEDDTPKWD